MRFYLAQNNAEMMFTTVVEFLGMFVFSYTVSSMAELVGNLNVKSRDFYVLLDRHLEYMRDKNTPLELQDRVLEFLSYQQASLLAQVSKNDEFCSKNEKLCIKNEELCI